MLTRVVSTLYGYNKMVSRTTEGSYLAKKGKKVAVLEKRHCIGGAAVEVSMSNEVMACRKRPLVFVIWFGQKMTVYASIQQTNMDFVP